MIGKIFLFIGDLLPVN